MNNYDIFKNLNNQKSICLISHISPDADALASMVVLKEFLLQQFNFNSVDIFAQETDSLDFYKSIIENNDINIIKKDYDIAIMLDSPNKERLGIYKTFFESACFKIVIDHHATNNFEGDINIVDFCSSTCEIIYSILSYYNYEISNKNKGKIYAGIITDTNNFTVGNFNSRTLKIASEIIDHVNKDEIYNHFLSNNTPQQMELLSQSIQNLKLIENNQIILSHISSQDIDNIHATQNDCSGIVNKLATISNSKLVCFIYPVNDIEHYVSLRAKNGYNVSIIAKKYGGGGHTGASAFLSTLTINDIEKLIEEEFKQQLKTFTVSTKSLF